MNRARFYPSLQNYNIRLGSPYGYVSSRTKSELHLEFSYLPFMLSVQFSNPSWIICLNTGTWSEDCKICSSYLCDFHQPLYFLSRLCNFICIPFTNIPNYTNALGWQHIRRNPKVEEGYFKHKAGSFWTMFLNDIVTCWGYVMSVTDEWMSMEGWWNDTDWEKNELIGEKPVWVRYLFATHHTELARNRNRASAATDCLSHGTAGTVSFAVIYTLQSIPNASDYKRMIKLLDWCFVSSNIGRNLLFRRNVLLPFWR